MAPAYVVLTALLIGLVLTLAAVAAALEGRLGHTLVGSDLRQVLHRKGVYPARSVPFLRDYASIGVIILSGLSFTHFTRQWSRIERLPGVLERCGLLRTDIIPTRDLKASFFRFARRSCETRWELISLAISGLLTGLIVNLIAHRGLYPLLDDGSTAAQRHFDEWWARPANGGVGFAVFLAVVLFFLYITVRHTIMGAHVLTWFADVRRCARSAGASGWLGYRDAWAPCDEGVAELRAAIIDVFWAILLGAGAAACAVWALALPAALLGLLLAYLLYNISIVVVPWVYFNAQLQTSKRELLARLREELRSLQESGVGPTDPRAEWIMRAHERAVDLPDRVLGRFHISALIALYLIPIAGVIPAWR